MANIIGVCGLIGNGKDAVSTHLEEQYGYKRISFAMALKDVCSVVFGWDREMMEGLTPEARKWREVPDLWWAERLGIPNFSPRMAMQQIGTNLFRDYFHKDIWVATVERRILDSLNEDPHRGIVISDCRFYNELQVIRDFGGMTVDVWRRNDRPVWWDDAILTNNVHPDEEYIIYDNGDHMEVAWPTVHSSEWSWAGWEFDRTLLNTGTLDELHTNIRKLLT